MHNNCSKEHCALFQLKFPRHLQTYNEVEEHIAAARRFYNSAANELKNAVEIFPSSFFARMLNIKAVDFFKAEEKERQAVNAADFLK